MSIVIDREWLEQRVAAKKALIIQYEAAIGALSTAGGISSYSINTGQTQQSVTRADLTQLRTALSALENDLFVLDAQLNGSSIRGIPDF